LPLRLDAIPELLRRTPRWVLWRHARLLDAAGRPRWAPVPVSVWSGHVARATDQRAWADFAAVADALPGSGCAGLGFVLHRPPRTPRGQPGLVALELHDCRDARTGRLAAWARDVVDAVGSYTELAPAGTGLHVWLLGALPAHGRRKADFASHQTGHFVAITGRHLAGTPRTVEHRQEALLRVHGWFFGKSEGRKANDELPSLILDPWGNCCGQPLPFGVIDARLQRCVGVWPRRVGARLFAPGADGGPLWLHDAEALFAWIERRFVELHLPAPQWREGAGYFTPGEYFRHLQQFAALASG
jgi:hypothetical protein